MTYNLHRTDWPKNGGWPEYALQPNHIAYLTARGVAPEVALARGYRSVVPERAGMDALPPGSWARAVREQWKAMISLGGQTQLGNSGLVLPLYTASNPAPISYQLRLDFPRTDPTTGKPRKFELPTGAERGTREGSIPADVNPLAHDLAGDAAVPVLLTEGVVKGDAVLSAARTIGLPLLPVSLTGVWMGVYGNTVQLSV